MHHEKHELDLLRDILHELRLILRVLTPSLPTDIQFQEVTMLAPVAGNTLVYTGTLSPAGSQFPSDATFALVSSDPTVTPTVDATGLIVTIPLPSTFVEPPATPFNVVYTASSASNPGWSVTATITPSAPANLPTGISFAQSV